MGGYATRANRFLSLTLSLMMTVTSPLLPLRYALGPARYSALSHLSVHPALLGSLPWLVAGDDQHMARSWNRACPVETTGSLMHRRRCLGCWVPGK